MAETKGFTEQEMTELKSALGEVENKLGTKYAKQIEDVVTKNESLGKELNDFKVKTEKLEADAVENQKALDAMIANQKKIDVINDGNVTSAFKKALEENADRLKNYKTNRQMVSFQLKTVGDIGANSNISVSGTPAFAHGGMLWGPGRKGFEVRHVRDLCRIVPQSEGTDAYVIRDSGGEGGPTTVAVGAVKPQSDRDWVKTIIPLTKIAHYYKIPEEYLKDLTWMQDEVTGVGVEELLAKEDSLFLTNSAGGEFLGLNQSLNSTAYSTPSALADLFTGANRDANEYDVLVAALTQLRIANPSSNANACLLHPADYARLLLEKDLNNNYIFGAPNAAIPNVMGVAIIPHTTVTSDKFFIGDFSKVKVGVRDGLSVRFYDQNEDDPIYNMVTVVIEERVTIAADRADRLIYGDFSDAMTELES